MIHVHRILGTGVLAICLFGPVGHLLGAEGAAFEGESQPAPAAKPLKELSPALGALRDRVRQTLATHQKQAFNTRENSATEIMSFCLAFGCDTEVALDGQGGKRLNGITALCWNYPCAGFEMLAPSEGHIAARIGYGCQERPGEFLAMLAMSRVPPNYPVRVGKSTRTVADLVEAEKLSCRAQSDLSLRLVGLSYYVGDPQWKNSLGETWSLERIIEEELSQAMAAAPEGGLNRLLGLGYAVVQQAKHQQPIEGQFQRAEKLVAGFQNLALRAQNDDGSWGPSYLAAKSASQDPAVQLRSTGRVLEWLAVSLSDKQLENARVVNAVDYLTRLVGSRRYQWNAEGLPTQEVVSLGHALHALVVYDQREFQPADAPEKPAAEPPHGR